LLAAFGYEFGALDNQENELSNSYQNMQLNTDGHPSSWKIAWWNLMDHFPQTGFLGMIMRWLSSIPMKGNVRLWKTRKIARGMARKLLDEKWSVGLGLGGDDNDSGMELSPGKRDVMSLLGAWLGFLQGVKKIEWILI
jgi:hypothetical protein